MPVVRVLKKQSYPRTAHMSLLIPTRLCPPVRKMRVNLRPLLSPHALHPTLLMSETYPRMEAARAAHPALRLRSWTTIRSIRSSAAGSCLQLSAIGKRSRTARRSRRPAKGGGRLLHFALLRAEGAR